MALKATVSCSLAFRGDGTSTVKSVSLGTAPIIMSGALSPSVSLATPTGAVLISSPQEVVIDIVLGLIRFTFTDPPENDALITVSFWLEF